MLGKYKDLRLVVRYTWFEFRQPLITLSVPMSSIISARRMSLSPFALLILPLSLPVTTRIIFRTPPKVYTSNTCSWYSVVK